MWWIGPSAFEHLASNLYRGAAHCERPARLSRGRFDVRRGLSVPVSPRVPCRICDPSRSPRMPITAKLSQLFYERLGDQVTNELAEWLNQVDQVYRSDLRELNELNFARFDAKLEQRIAELRAEFNTKIAELNAKIDTGLAQLDAKMERRFSEQLRWLFAGWVTIILAMIGLWARR
jgi:hypothetical protein